MAKDAGVYAVGMDIDAAGLITLALHGKPEGVKSYIDGIADDLKSAMILTGCNSITEISSRILAK